MRPCLPPGLAALLLHGLLVLFTGQVCGAPLRVVTFHNPLDPNSLFAHESAPDPGNPDGAILSFPSVDDRTYTVWRSHDLGTWTNLGSTPGTGAIVDLSVQGDPARPVNLFRIEVSLPAP